MGKSYLGLFRISAISTLGWRQTMPNDSSPERPRLLPSRGHSAYSGIRHSRHTFATEHLRHGVDIRTLQSWMGHRDIQSTMVYLKGVQSKDALAKVNAGALARYVA